MDEWLKPGPAEEIKDATTMGMLAMALMMAVCCLGILLLLVLIPTIGWRMGLVVAVIGGAALMYGHHRLMRGHSH